MIDVRVIVNFFGNPPRVFPLWLASCGANPEVTWIFFTDIDMSQYVVPHNIRVVQTDFDAMRTRIQSCFPYSVRYEKPWDFCALKPLLSTIFNEELKGADYWGWSDVDMIYGDLSPVLALAQEGYDKIMPNGHFSIVRNDPELTSFIASHPCTKKAISANEAGLPCYDERDFRFTVMREYGARQASEVVPYIHLYPRWGHFSFNVSKAASRLLGLGDDGSCPVLFTWKDRHLIGHFALPDRTIRKLDLAYVHFFKRDIRETVGTMEKGKTYLIAPNGVRAWGGAEQLSRSQVLWINRPRLHWKYIKDRLNWATVERKIKRFLKGRRNQQGGIALVEHSGC